MKIDVKNNYALKILRKERKRLKRFLSLNSEQIQKKVLEKTQKKYDDLNVVINEVEKMQKGVDLG